MDKNVVIKNNLRLVQFLDIEEAHLKPNLQEQQILLFQKKALSVHNKQAHDMNC